MGYCADRKATTMSRHRTPPLTIGTCAASPGRIARGLLPAGQTAARKAVYLPVQIATGFFPGPTVLLTAALHGDEVAGVEVIRQLFAQLPLQALRGTLIAVPVANPPGFRRGQRTVPEEESDLNRCFPGERDGTLAAQIAWHLFEEVLRKVEFAIDLHDAGRHNILYPHCRLPADSTPRLRELARAFGTEILVERDGASGMLAIEAQRLLDLPVLTIELGGGQQLHGEVLQAGVRGLMNLLYHLQMLPGEAALPTTQLLLREQAGIPAPLSGLLHCPHAVGTALPMGAVIAEITDPFSGREEELRAPHAGILFSRKATARIDEGESLGSLLAFQPDARWGALPLDGQLFDNALHTGPRSPALLRESMARIFSPEWHRLAAE